MGLDAYIGEIAMFGGNFAPRGWAFCNGQLLSIAQNTALFSILGTTYGGDGRVTFGLPNLQSRVPMHPGQGPGLTPRTLGEMDGVETVSLLTSQMPMHSHIASATVVSGESQTPGNTIWASEAVSATYVYSNAAPSVPMHVQSLGIAGGSLPHSNMPPYLTINFIIALQGIFPPRS